MRNLLTYKDYFLAFYSGLPEKAQQKIDYALMLQKMQSRVSKKFVKHISEGVYELRAEYESNSYRIFFIFDKGDIVILMNAFQKKSQKTPKKQIELALRLKDEYYGRKERTEEL